MFDVCGANEIKKDTVGEPKRRVWQATCLKWYSKSHTKISTGKLKKYLSLGTQIVLGPVTSGA